MPVTDPIADLLTRIRNAARARKTLIHVPYSKMKEAICAVLKEKGYVLSLQVSGEGVVKELVIEIPENREDLHLKSMSKPGQRIYLGTKEIPRVLNGLGVAILSTPKGIMSGDQARKQKLGGEFLCEIY
ncbi:30S ribosomal protein S8 [Candidatus Peregrinibacteria bacterium RIFCSPLOWO2_02_FULL_48_14]|nr:MAG: 30S ribosomal protein S8 [Candidatus Peregrinibacteria bacterium RIFCSPLOWO2_02_FULL_48_14]